MTASAYVRSDKKETAMRTNILKKILTMTLAFAMVFTMIPLLGVGVQEVNAAESAPGGTVKSNSTTDAESAFGANNVTATYNSSSKTLTIKLDKDIELSVPVVFEKGATGDTVVLDLGNHTLTGKAGTAGTNLNEAAGKDAIRIVAADYNVKIQGPGTVIGGKGAIYKVGTELYKIGHQGGMAVSFADSNWRPESTNGKLSYGLTVTGNATLKGGDGATVTGADWIYNVENYKGDKYEPLTYQNFRFQLVAGPGGAAIGQTGEDVAGGKSGKAYARIVVEKDSDIIGGKGGRVDLSTDGMPLLTHHGLMNYGWIDTYLNGTTVKEAYSQYVENQIRFKPGKGGDGIVIGDGRKYVLIDSDGTVEGGACGDFDYGRSKYVNQYDSIGAGDIAVAGNGMSVYGDIGLTNISPSDTSVNEETVSSKTRNSNDMGICVAGIVKGGTSPDANGKNEYSGHGGDGIAIDGKYGRENWGIIAVSKYGSVLGGDTGDTAYGKVGVPGDGIRELRTKGKEVLDTRFGTDYHIINGNVKGGNGGDSLGTQSAGGGSNGMTFNTYRKNLRIYGIGKATGGDAGQETDHGQTTSTHRAEGIHMGTDSSNIVKIGQVKGSAATQMSVNKIPITATMSHFTKNPSDSTTLSVSGIPDGYADKAFIMWYATIYESSSAGAGTYSIESAGTDHVSFNMLNNTAYKGHLAYPAYPGYITIDNLNMNKYNAAVATADRMSEDDKYQTDIYCYVVLEDGRWGKSNVMRYQKNKGWDGTGNLPDDDGGEDPEPIDPDMAEALAVGQAIRDLPKPENVTQAHNSAIVDAHEKYHALGNEKINQYLFDYDYGAKVDACFEALAAIVGNDDQALIVNINNILKDLPGKLSLENEAKVKAAQAAYNNLSATARASFDEEHATEKGKLDAAVAEIDRLRAAADADYCAHTNIVAVDSKPATCHEKGNISYYRCTACDTYFSDYGGLSKIEDKSSVELQEDPNSHEFGVWKTTENPTCKDVGKKQRTCKYHSDVTQTENIPVDQSKHSWGAWTTTTQPTCSSPGEEKRTCSACKKEETHVLNALEHEWGAWDDVEEATCTKDGLRRHECSKCHAEETEVIPAGHQWGKWTTDKAATCTAGGIEKRVCGRDASHVETRNTAALGHSWSSWTSQQPTEESQGIVTHRCNRCGSTYYTAIAPITLPTDLPYVKASKPAKGKKAVTVKWKKVKKKNQKKIGGIEIQVTGPGVNMVVTAGKKKSSKKIKGLMPKQKYSCRVRAYNYIGGVKHVSAWSNWKTAKTK